MMNSQTIEQEPTEETEFDLRRKLASYSATSAALMIQSSGSVRIFLPSMFLPINHRLPKHASQPNHKQDSPSIVQMFVGCALSSVDPPFGHAQDSRCHPWVFYQPVVG